MAANGGAVARVTTKPTKRDTPRTGYGYGYGYGDGDGDGTGDDYGMGGA